MSGPTPKPRDQRKRRNKTEGTQSTTVVLSDATPRVDWLDQFPVDTIEVESGGDLVTIPKPPAGMLKPSKQRWVIFWLSPEASMIRPLHMPALERLALMYDQEERLRRRVNKSRLITEKVMIGLDGPAEDGDEVIEYETRVVRIPGHLGVGSQGQLVESPDSKALMAVRKEIRALEDRFAGSPMATFRVGWQHAAMLNEQSRAREAQELAAAAAQMQAQHQALMAGGDG